MAESAPPASRVPRKCHRRSCSASAASLVPTSYEELRLCQTLQANAATIVDLWQTRRAASSATAAISAAPVAAVLPDPSANPMAQPAPLQQPTSASSKLATPICSIDPSACPLPAVTLDEQMDSTSSRKRGRDDEGSDCDAPRKHVQPAHNPSRPETHGGCDALPRPAQLSATVGGMSQPSMAAPTPNLPQHSAVAFLKENSQPMTVNSVRKKKGKSKRRRAPSTSQLPEKPAINASDTETASQSPCPKEVPRSANGTASSQPHASDPAPEDFTLASSRGARRRARALASSPVLPADPAVAGTVLFKPSAPNGAFMQSSRLALASALSSRPGVIKVRVNSRRNIVAADVSSRECIEELLGVTELCGIPVSARLPADRGYSTGYLHGVEGDLTDDDLLQSIESSVPLVSAARNGNTVTLRFAGPVPPEHVSLYKLRCRVRPARPRPLQCLQCGRLGHATATCRRANCCLRCGRSHPSTESCSARPRCVNCGHNHPANTPTCRKWQEERKVATIMASSTVPLSRRAVRAMVQEANHSQLPTPPASAATRTYAQAVSGTPPPAPTPAVPQSVDACSVLPSPASKASPVSPAMKQSASPTAQLRDDPRDAIIASLQLTLRAVGELLPSGSPLKAICLQAGGLQNTPSHHG
ncbi:uncharacterized protein LOC119376683 [Rhipicephalus sanguineus]|uniref:CCHC-type domain-containing protein n=1 Tax=Rhipicephalus sanguineus TaxID=34632 RepID=A0A9D4YS36_RHISA|nr:uncharacterized protein LOC119376683 [Rhipicephalus sanguineus]KAH7987858.1 hypothetical protein HPB52_024579 [Rhipicephalus sanguineus]